MYLLAYHFTRRKNIWDGIFHDVWTNDLPNPIYITFPMLVSPIPSFTSKWLANPEHKISSSEKPQVSCLVPTDLLGCVSYVSIIQRFTRVLWPGKSQEVQKSRGGSPTISNHPAPNHLWTNGSIYWYADGSGRCRCFGLGASLPWAGARKTG